jgi:hypothetical protein
MRAFFATLGLCLVVGGAALAGACGSDEPNSSGNGGGASNTAADTGSGANTASGGAGGGGAKGAGGTGEIGMGGAGGAADACHQAADICQVNTGGRGGVGEGGGQTAECSGTAECVAECIVASNNCDVANRDLAACINACP